MEYLKNLGKSLLYIFSIIIVSTFIITFFNYFNIIGSKILSILKILTILISMFVGGTIIGKNSKQKGWFEGIKLGLIVIIILALFKYLGLNEKFSITNILYYIILTISCTLGSMIGINKKKNDWFFKSSITKKL